MEQDDKIEVMDIEDFRNPEDQQFSHQALVMMAMRKIVEYGCQELVPGYYNTEEDNKGKVKIIYKQDTRKAFIESVRTLRMIMICDFDTEAKKILKLNKESDQDPDNNLMDKIKARKKFWIDQQQTDWNKLSQGQKNQMIQQGKGIMEGYFNMDLPYFQNYFLEELEIYRDIFEELTELTSRLKFYKQEMSEG
ncbi:MAG TPA: hypothetical protein ENH99_02405 [Candidatus Pacearchaeota archaeon]|nr:hypothetical protein [Candidatus Pacearchaeota archaeon]